MALPMATFSVNPKKHDPIWWYSTEKNKGDDEIWNWNENVEFEKFCLIGMISRNPSEKRSVKSFPPRKFEKHQQIKLWLQQNLFFALVFAGVSEQKQHIPFGISNCSLKLLWFRYGNTAKGTAVHCSEDTSTKVCLFWGNMSWNLRVILRFYKVKISEFQTKCEFLWKICVGYLSVAVLPHIFVDKCNEASLQTNGTEINNWTTCTVEVPMSRATSPSNHHM